MYGDFDHVIRVRVKLRIIKWFPVDLPLVTIHINDEIPDVLEAERSMCLVEAPKYPRIDSLLYIACDFLVRFDN
jgi:hypothetical protein